MSPTVLPRIMKNSIFATIKRIATLTTNIFTKQLATGLTGKKKSGLHGIKLVLPTGELTSDGVCLILMPKLDTSSLLTFAGNNVQISSVMYSTLLTSGNQKDKN
jgi:hypothetical protein